MDGRLLIDMKKYWKYINYFLLVVGTISSVNDMLGGNKILQVPSNYLFVLFLSSALFVFITIVAQNAFSAKEIIWKNPSLSESPFDFSQPLSSYFLLGAFLLVPGILCLIIYPFFSDARLMNIVVLPIMGGGLLTGWITSFLIFKKRRVI